MEWNRSNNKSDNICTALVIRCRILILANKQVVSMFGQVVQKVVQVVHYEIHASLIQTAIGEEST